MRYEKLWPEWSELFYGNKLAREARQRLLGPGFSQRAFRHTDFILQHIQSTILQIILQNGKGLWRGGADNDLAYQVGQMETQLPTHPV